MITVLIDKDNYVYCYNDCHETEEGFLPSLELDNESRVLGCKMLIILKEQIPEGVELWQCKFNDGVLEYCQEKVDFVETSVLRSERESEFKLYDKYQLPYIQGTLTAEQISEYSAWRQAWLDVTETKIKPERPLWFN